MDKKEWDEGDDREAPGPAEFEDDHGFPSDDDEDDSEADDFDDGDEDD